MMAIRISAKDMITSELVQISAVTQCTGGRCCLSNTTKSGQSNDELKERVI